MSAALFPTQIASAENTTSRRTRKSQRFQNQSREYNTPYTKEHLNRIAFPLGGLGAGMICMEGTGAISHVSVKNRPEMFHEPGMFAALHVKGVENGSKILEGPVPDWKKFGRRNSGNGSGGDTTGLPHFHDASFDAKFPFASIELSDKDLPLKIGITAWSPFVPTEEDDSSLPVAAFEYDISNTSGTELECIFSFNTKNFLSVNGGKNSIQSMHNGFVLVEKGNAEKPLESSFAIALTEECVVDHCWFRGGWWDPLTMAWNNVKNGEAKSHPPVPESAPGASIFLPFKIPGKGNKNVRLLMAWFTPESDLTIGKVGEACDPSTGCCNSPADLGLNKYAKRSSDKTYKPWYASKFSDVKSVQNYFKDNYDELKNKSQKFTNAFYTSTLPSEVVEAVACNLSILKSPTVMRQYDGRLWNYEGCGDDFGCCHGSCTHVWNYAQAIPHLFPALERSLRDTEFCENQNKEGHQNFRANLPISPNTHEFHSAADGQLGGIMKVYREWRISGDSDWMKKIFPLVKTSMDYCIKTWDPRHKGVIEEPHHNTYDIEFWGPDGMHTSFYLGALAAIIEMGSFFKEDVRNYKRLLENGKKVMENALYDGEYFIQKIQVDGLVAKNPATSQSFGGEYSEEARDLLQKEGPKYQYGSGCLSDGVLGAWIGRMCGLRDVVDPVRLSSHLKAVHKYNLKDNLSEHANPQRPSFALGEEGGLLLCTWPKGGKLSLPFVYSDEVWTGIEHQVAAHLMLMGHVKEGLEIVRASRNRYDGRIRNPFNEYECGHWYARALSSYGYLQALTGVRYDAVTKTLFVDSQVGDFTSFLSTENGFGTVTLRGQTASVEVYHGSIEIDKTVVGKKV